MKTGLAIKKGKKRIKNWNPTRWMTDVPRISTICRISPFNQIFFPFLSIFPFSPFFLRVRFINLFLCSYFPYFLSGPYTSEESGSLSSIIDILSNSYSGYSGAGFWSTERAGWLLQWVQLLRITLYAHIGYLLPYCIERLFCLLAKYSIYIIPTVDVTQDAFSSFLWLWFQGQLLTYI